MQVKDFMTTSVVTVSPDMMVNQVADVLFEHHFTGVPVVDSSNKLLGIISERDFIASDSHIYLPTYIQILQDMDYIKGDKKRLPEAAQAIIHATAKDIMNQTVVTATPDMGLNQLAQLFAHERVNPIPVLDENKNIVGIISRSDLIKLFSEKNI